MSRFKQFNWEHANCPLCGERYAYLPAYKPATCSKFECTYKWLHPELYPRKEVVPINDPFNRYSTRP